VVPKGPVGLLKSQVSVAAFAGDNAIPPIVTVRAVARATCLSATAAADANATDFMANSIEQKAATQLSKKQQVQKNTLARF